MQKPYLSVIVPVFNEEHNVRSGVLESIDDFLNKQKYRFEVIFVDDKSTDNTLRLIQNWIKSKPYYRVVNNKHQGKALTVLSGIRKAEGDAILYCDFDQATPLSEIDKLLPYIHKGFDVVIGSRSDVRKGAPFSRKIMAKGFIVLRSLLLGLGVVDTQCGFKLFSRNAISKIIPRLKLYSDDKTVHGSHVTAGFDVEILFVAKKKGLKIKEVPVLWKYVETRRVNPLRDSFEGLTGLIKIKLNDLRGFY